MATDADRVSLIGRPEAEILAGIDCALKSGRHGPKWGRAVNEAKIAALEEEMESIHAADTLYWKQGTSQTREERVEYQRRQVRLREIRSELAALRLDS